jgi:hypothetical protein
MGKEGKEKELFVEKSVVWIFLKKTAHRASTYFIADAMKLFF